MRVLVTGVGGFLGSHIVEQLLTLNCEVIGVDSLTHNGESPNLVAAVQAAPDHRLFHWIQHDLRAPFSGTQVQQIGHIDAVVNTASLASVDVSIHEPVNFVRNNVDVALHVLELARVTQPRCFIQVSTDEVYGTTVPCAGSDHTPSSPYAASKAAQEDLCNAWRQTFNVPVSIVRSANMFGERQSTLAFIPRIVQALVNDDEVTIHVDERGAPGTRNYSYVGNVARYIAHRVTQDSRARHDITLRGQTTIDNLGLALNVAALLDRKLRYRLVNAITIRPGYDRKYELHGDFWYPELPAGEALRRTVTHTARRMGLDV